MIHEQPNAFVSLRAALPTLELIFSADIFKEVILILIIPDQRAHQAKARCAMPALNLNTELCPLGAVPIKGRAAGIQRRCAIK